MRPTQAVQRLLKNAADAVALVIDPLDVEEDVLGISRALLARHDATVLWYLCHGMSPRFSASGECHGAQVED